MLHPMRRILKAEFYKLWRMKIFWGLLVISCVLSCVLLLDGSPPAKPLDIFNHILYTTPLLYVLIMIFGALFIGSDFENRTIQSYISAGHKRGDILLAKFIVHLTGCISILYLPLFAGAVAGCILFGITGATLPALFLKSMLAIWIICAMGMLPCLCGFLFQGVGKALTLPLVLFFVMLFLLNGRHYHLMAAFLPMGQLRLLCFDQLTNLYAFLTNFLWSFICCVWAYWNFSRTDLK